MEKYYSEDNYVSIWLGKCENSDILDEYLEKDYSLVDLDDVELFKMGEDFEIISYDEDICIVDVFDKYSNSIDELLDVSECRIAVKELKKIYGEVLSEKYNICIMFFNLKYDGHIKKVKNELYGEYTFYGSFLK